MDINKKLKGIYFFWLDKQYAPSPDSWNDTFENYLQFTRYDFADDWFEKVLAECMLSGRQEFDEQVLLIRKEYQKYSDQQKQKRDRKLAKKHNKFLAQCRKLGVPAF